MTYGLQFKNDDNDIIVDSDFEHYHFAGKGAWTGDFVTPPLTGGTTTNHSYAGSQTLSTSQVPGRVHIFTLSARATSGSPAPLVFIKSRTDADMGHILTKRNGANWEFWILTSLNAANSANIPVIYCFLPLDEMSASAATAASGETYGVATFNSSGDRTYDSRMKPLKIVGTVSLTSAPANAHSHTNASYNPNFTPNTQTTNIFNNSGSNSYTGATSDLMFCCPSIAHACQDYEYQAAGEGFQPQGNNSYFYSWARADLWWGFYRGTFRIEPLYPTGGGSSVGHRIWLRYTGYAYGHVWNSIENSTGIFGALAAIALSFFTFGASLLTLGVFITAAVLASSFSGIAADGGLYYPYRNDTRNRGQNNPMLFATWSQYD
jgi:hypothetical protein